MKPLLGAGMASPVHHFIQREREREHCVHLQYGTAYTILDIDGGSYHEEASKEALSLPAFSVATKPRTQESKPRSYQTTNQVKTKRVSTYV